MRWTAEADYPQELALSRGGDCLRLLGLGQLVVGCPREGHARLGEEPARGLVKPRVLWRLVYLVPVVAGCDCSWRWRARAASMSCQGPWLRISSALYKEFSASARAKPKGIPLRAYRGDRLALGQD